MKQVKNPLCTVIMPSYNSAATISRSIESVLCQSYKNIQLIIIDDFSTDETKAVVEAFEDDRIFYIRLSSNSGSPAVPRNTGLRLCRGKYIAFLDSDDRWEENKLEVQISAMERFGYLFSCTPYVIEDDVGRIISTYSPPKVVCYKELLINNSIGCLTAVVNKSLLSNFEFPQCGHEDYALWLKLLKNNVDVYSVDEYGPLAAYRKAAGSISSNKKKLMTFFWHIYRREENFGVMRSIYFCFRYLINVAWFKYS